MRQGVGGRRTGYGRRIQAGVVEVCGTGEAGLVRTHGSGEWAGAGGIWLRCRCVA